MGLKVSSGLGSVTSIDGAGVGGSVGAFDGVDVGSFDGLADGLSVTAGVIGAGLGAGVQSS